MGEDNKQYNPLLDENENGLMEWTRDETYVQNNPSNEEVLPGKVQGNVVALIISWIETMFCIVEFLFSLFASVCLRNIFEYILSRIINFTLLSDDTIMFKMGGIFGSVIDTSVALLWIMHRYAGFFHMNRKELFKRLGLSQLKLSKMARCVICYHIIGFSIMLGLQHYTGRWYFSMENYLLKGHNEIDVTNKKEIIDYTRVGEMLFFSPLKEEILFRALAFHILYNRYSSISVCIAIANTTFGAVHLVNFLNSGYTATYIFLQMWLGLEVGIFYSLRFLLTGCLWECIILHVVNNTFSSFMPIEAINDLSDPILFLALLQTVLLYGILSYICAKELANTSLMHRKTY